MLQSAAFHFKAMLHSYQAMGHRAEKTEHNEQGRHSDDKDNQEQHCEPPGHDGGIGRAGGSLKVGEPFKHKIRGRGHIEYEHDGHADGHGTDANEVQAGQRNLRGINFSIFSRSLSLFHATPETLKSFSNNPHPGIVCLICSSCLCHVFSDTPSPMPADLHHIFEGSFCPPLLFFSGPFCYRASG